MTVVLDAQAPAAGPAGGADAWLAVVRGAMALYRTKSFHEVTRELVAVEIGMPLAEVESHFPTLNDLVIAVVQVWNAERMEPILPIAGRMGAVAFLRSIVIANIADPSLMRMLTATVNLAATPDHPLAPMLQRLWLRFHAHVQRTLTQDIADGREPVTMDPARGAEQLIALYEGLQLQAMVRSHMNLLDAYDRAVTRLRAGWQQEYQPPIWEI